MSKAQLEMFARQEGMVPAEPVSYKPDPNRVRRRLDAVLQELRGADAMPWDRKTLAFHQLVFPQMIKVLPDEEAAQVFQEFQFLLRRLD